MSTLKKVKVNVLNVIRKCVINATDKLIMDQAVIALLKNKLKIGKMLQTFKNVRSVMV